MSEKTSKLTKGQTSGEYRRKSGGHNAVLPVDEMASRKGKGEDDDLDELRRLAAEFKADTDKKLAFFQEQISMKEREKERRRLSVASYKGRENELNFGDEVEVKISGAWVRCRITDVAILQQSQDFLFILERLDEKGYSPGPKSAEELFPVGFGTR